MHIMKMDTLIFFCVSWIRSRNRPTLLLGDRGEREINFLCYLKWVQENPPQNKKLLHLFIYLFFKTQILFICLFVYLFLRQAKYHRHSSHSADGGRIPPPHNTFSLLSPSLPLASSAVAFFCYTPFSSLINPLPFRHHLFIAIVIVLSLV